jgi:hypothetical protein
MVAPGEIVLPAPLSVDDGGGWPVALIAGVVVVLVVGALFVGLRLRSIALKITTKTPRHEDTKRFRT